MQDNQLTQVLENEEAQVQFGRLLGQACAGDGVIFLQGTLGMGKTTLTRGILQAYGHQGAVKSPTYTLVEPYQQDDALIYHFDLYRLADPEELEYMGIRDYFSEQALCVIEWPDKGQGVLPVPDIELTLDKEGEGRRATLVSKNVKGAEILGRLRTMS
ncbi:tRNA (adenosine(37)-N6)-threonylcarbamoyltransferase complex ATPase subunit type 1 TsaE [Oceanospirillum sediminis]|uniref:tRNA threonylcarbamoyladenosine biosynthesis protein TsaE n=1 Tax=Oceanospirillum sediminis TaxID=2760088 RepID=A0A839IJA6_9GAMM|nr:tRNA (adenosine(37)-N6)-threonylcarbamoyltransferase complex ATPase subunit type 1 TsaE [Oceanospirillum sediminis]MBB1485008.1 tRNA (adenosine(37)-N6)-threonylcarbamoyltransferase complex ATPase subunit type 1 TsaE [Oceanospirillum sediminis]